MVVELKTREDVLAADRRLVALSRGGGRLRLRIGEALELLERSGGIEELGFSSVRGYALERWQERARWAAESYGLARRLLRKDERGLPLVRAAVMAGQLSWSMADLVARHAPPDEEAEFMEAATQRTVAQMVTWIAAKAEAKNAASEAASKAAADSQGSPRAVPKRVPVPTREEIEEEPSSALRLRVTAQEVLLLHASRKLVGLLDGRRPSDEHFWAVLLAESMSTLTDPKTGDLACASVPPIDETRLRGLLERGLEEQRRREAEAEKDLSKKVEKVELEPLAPLGPLPTTPVELDAEVRRCSKLLVVRDLEIGRLVRELFAVGAPKMLKYASKEQYARERVGMSLAALRARVRLAKWVEEMPEIGEAIEAGELGFEAAMLVGRVANPDTAPAWIDRAKRRTIKHLREEVEAVQLRSRVNDEASLEPPTDEELEEVEDFERAVGRGEMFEATIGPKRDQQISVTDGAGCELFFRVSAFVVAELHRQRVVYERVRPPDTPMTFVEFLCASLFKAWLPTVASCSIAYTSVYQRDRWQCTNPVCEEPATEPHHVVRRSRGGSDKDENVTGTGNFCHRPGIHEGRLRVTGTAGNLTWTIGRDPIMVVRGREKKNLKN
jgi:hypothetical protein